MSRQGDDRAFEQIVEQYSDSLYRFCHGILCHQEDAEEALQTTMLRAYTALRGIERRVVLRPWLFRVARNVCIDLIRGRPNWTALSAVSEPSGGDVSERHELSEQLEGLRRDIAQLDEPHRSALLLREMSGLSHREIGDTLGTSPESAKRLIFELLGKVLVERIDCFDEDKAIPYRGQTAPGIAIAMILALIDLFPDLIPNNAENGANLFEAFARIVDRFVFPIRLVMELR